MRTGSLIALAGLAALGLSGCASIEKTQSAAAAAAADVTDEITEATTAGVITPADPDAPATTGSSSGSSSGQNIPDGEGSTAFVYNDRAFNVGGNAKLLVTVTDAAPGDAPITNETANVAVATGFSAMTWADPIEMALFRTTVDGIIPEDSNIEVPTDGLSFNPDFYSAAVTNPNFTGYKEYRKITSTSDAELQVWSYQHSRIGQYTVFNDPSAPNNNNVAVFFDGDATPTSGLPANTATYNGKFGGVATVSNFTPILRTVNDPFVSSEPSDFAGQTYDPNGIWRIAGDSRVVADFTNGTVNGTITNTTWRKFTGRHTHTIVPAEPNKPFHDYTFNGTITDNTFSGRTLGPAGGVVTGNNGVNGGFFGPNAEEVAGVVSAETTVAQPSDGITTNDINRRAFINMRGVFQGTKQ